jgi:hypothetical protein
MLATLERMAGAKAPAIFVPARTPSPVVHWLNPQQARFAVYVDAHMCSVHVPRPSINVS